MPCFWGLDWRLATGSVLETGLSIASVLYGALLGVFLLGMLTKRPGEASAIIGMTAGFLATLLLRAHVAYTWYVLIGSAATCLVGYGASLVLPRTLDRSQGERAAA